MFKKLASSSLVKSAGVYTISNMINSAIPFLMLPILTRYLNPVDYGLVATFQVLLGFVSPFTGLSIDGAIGRKYYEKGDVDLPTYIGNCLLILLGSTTLVGLILWLFAGPISKLVSFPADWFWSVVLVAVAQFIGVITLTLWQVRVRPVPYGLFQIGQTAANFGLSLWLVIVWKLNWQGRVWGQLIAVTIFAVFGLIILWRTGWLKFRINSSYIKSALLWGLPLLPHAFGAWIRVATDRIFINNMVGVAATGVYQVGFQVAAVIGLLETSFNAAWVPWFYARLKANNWQTKINIIKFTYLYVGGVLLLAISLGMCSPWLLSFLVGKDFTQAGPFVVWISLARGVEAMYFMTCNYIFYSTKTAYVAAATFTSALVHLVATYFLIRVNGTVGAAQATVISSTVSVVLTWFFANRLHPMPWLLNFSKLKADRV